MSSQEDWAPVALRAEERTSGGGGGAAGYPDRNAVLERLSDDRRRRILAVLLEASEPVAEDDLATRVAAVEAGTDPGAVSAETADDLAVELYHLHLPALADVGLVEWDRDAGTVTTSDHPAFDAPGFRGFLEAEADPAAAVESLADPRRRRVLAVLEAADGPTTRAELARAVATHETGGPGASDYEDVLVRLHHVDLPRLEEAGLVECDPDAETVTYAGHPGIAEEWLSP